MIFRLQVPTNNSSAIKTDRHPLSPLLIGLLVSLQTGCQSTTQQPNAVRDLLVDRISWQTYAVPGDTTRRIEHGFAITNTSAHDSYRHIQLCFDYYTRAGQRLGSDTSVVDTLVAPGTLVKFAHQRIGTLRPGMDRTDVRVLRAETD